MEKQDLYETSFMTAALNFKMILTETILFHGLCYGAKNIANVLPSNNFPGYKTIKLFAKFAKVFSWN